MLLWNFLFVNFNTNYLEPSEIPRQFPNGECLNLNFIFSKNCINKEINIEKSISMV